ncbi:MAG: MFS transporter, partial [Gammaproteobacteria bacterium]
ALCCGVGVILISSVSDIFLASIGRLITGFGASFAFVGALYVVNHFFAPKWFTTLSGAVNMLGMLGTAVGVVWLTGLIESQGWQEVFRGTGILLLLVAALAWFLIPSTDPTTTNVAQSSSVADSLRRIVLNKAIWLVAVIGLFYYVPINVFGALWGNDSLQHLQGFSSQTAEQAVAMIFWGMAVGSVLIGFLSSHLGHRKWLIVAGSVLANLCFLALILAPEQGLSLLAAQLLLFGGGLFCGAQMLTFAMAKDSESPDHAGTAMAFVNMLGIGGAIIFQPFFGWLLDASNGSYLMALITIPAALLLTTVLALAVRESR